jgi:predicted kinase
MPTDRRLSALVTAGVEVTGPLDALARVLADFHTAAERSPEADQAATATAMSRRWSENTSHLQPFTGRFVAAGQVATVEALAQRYLAGRADLFDERISAGRACDGHGDLLADDVFCLEDGPRVLDCLEFDDDLRLGDALADVAFLAMDLERLGRADLAERFLRTYAAAADDSWPRSLARHHIAYRAQVRAKVAAIRAEQSGATTDDRASALLDLSRRHLEAARVRLVLVGGLPGTGKSTLAADLAEATGAVVLRTDVLRKERAGLDPGQSAAAGFGEGIYSAESTAATYDELRARARHELERVCTVILDASWSDDEQRASARQVAFETHSDLVELRCIAPPAVTEARIRARARRGGDPSDADSATAAAMAAVADAWPTATEIDTTAARDEIRTAALAVFDRQAVDFS